MKHRIGDIFHTRRKRNGTIVLFATVMLAVGMILGLIARNEDISEIRLLTKLGYTKTLVTDMIDNRTTFSKDNEQINQIVESLPLQSYRKYISFSLQTEPSKEINVIYEIDDSYSRGGNGLDPFPGVVEENNTLLLFSTIEGLEKVNFLSYDDYDKQELNRTDSYTMDDLIPRFGKIEPLSMGFSDLYNALASNIQLSEFYFAHYSRIYLGTDPEHVSYRNGEPDEIRQQSDGSTVWIYPNFGEIYSISPDHPNTNPQNTAMYYFNSAIAEKNDGLTGLYATRFVYGDNAGKTYEDITEVLGLPSISKDMGGGDKYIAYALAEGQQKNAYFIFHNDKVIEEGVMYGNDYTMLNLEQSASANDTTNKGASEKYPEFTAEEVANAKTVVERYFKAWEDNDEDAWWATWNREKPENAAPWSPNVSIKLKEIHYDQQDRMRHSYITSGGGNVNQTPIDHVIVFKCDFNVHYTDGVETGAWNEGDYTDWNVILVRQGIGEPWFIVDNGY